MTTTSVTSGASRLLGYVPRLLLRWTPTRDHPRHMRVDGTLAFVDISGFTALTERLARKGRAPTTPCVPRARHTACGQRCVPSASTSSGAVTLRRSMGLRRPDRGQRHDRRSAPRAIAPLAQPKEEVGTPAQRGRVELEPTSLT